ncbi:type VI secretion system ATPase and inner membrane protein TssM [Syntrophotalea carbinolica DSM 2380]|uniref:Type VI secretion system ATPase and inner membrane protein TssM n=1 Tax=Syntrophotalea carbinolica (strain DSM 2380 / NBRC 103641 / GraBd1) TaxID=338963 RepID=Q3A0R1_SYNC1|nr:type VI secretion system membrane subunit TssM [Syntrophotalea carbinolica]ABA90046.1 type VI secretion system ATPase and inner membrane protein TssM [Syntrophotalea carbinolica DSM 2380]
MQNILIFLQAYLFGRLGSRILGLMLILSLIWWAGPYVGIDDTSLRIYLILGTLTLFFGIWLVRKSIAKRRGNQFRQDLDSQTGQDQSRQLEIEELKAKMNQAVASLKSSELGSHRRGNAALYALPWFMIIGPSAAGKTTLLRNSGLHFPYANGEDIDIRGFGGTRNCDWWFSNEAVLLDTAGRYTTEQDDHEEWLAFLSMLRKHRRQQPLTGAIVAISLSDLLTADTQELERHVKIIRDRINELTTKLGCIFPIYIVFTKCDLLYGFSSYFADLTPKEREQVWGSWLGHEKDSNICQAFIRRMETLHHRLCELRLQKLSMVRNMRAKSELFDFPSQFEAAKDRLVAFISRLTEANPYQDTPHFCGIYLTSATQEGTPLQKILGNIRQAFGYVDEDQSSEQAETKSFFVKDFFKEVVFPNANDVSRTKKQGILHRALKTACIITSLAVITGCFLLLSTTLTMNTLLLKKGTDTSEHLAQEAQTKNNGVNQDFKALTQVLAHYRTLMNYEKHLPLSYTLGIYEGDKQLPAIRSILLNAFKRIFFKPAIKDLEMRLVNYSQVWAAADLQRQDQIRDPYYKTLKCYLMLSTPKRLEAEFAAPVLQTLIQERLMGFAKGQSLDKDSQRQLSELIHLYLSHMQIDQNHPDYMETVKLEASLVTDAQNHLKAIPDAGRLYTQILNKGKLIAPALHLKDMIKGPGRSVLASSFTMPFMFTSKGWHNYVQPEIDNLVHIACQGDWVTGYLPDSLSDASGTKTDTSANNPLAVQLETEIRALYFADYVDHWFSLLAEIQLPPFHSLDDAAKKMLLLARNDGPIAELLQVVSRNINIGQAKGSLASDGSVQSASLVQELENPLHDLRKLTDPGDKMNTSLLINQYLLALTAAQAEIEQMAAAVDVPQQSFQYASTILGSNGVTSSELYKCWLSTNSLLNGTDVRTRKVAEHLLYKPIAGAWKAIIQQTQSYVQNQWSSTVFLNYQGKIAGKFPFSNNGADASLNDVADFFRPEDGLIWAFTDDQLKPFLRKERNRWTEKTWLGTGLAFDKSLLRSLGLASRITSGMFRRGQIQPDVHFSIYPIPSQGLRVVRFETNGQQMIYQNEPQEWKRFQWPGDEDQNSAFIGCIPSGNQSMVKIKFSGDWSLFHLLNKAKITQNHNLYTLDWKLKTGQNNDAIVHLKLRPDRHSNVFAQGLFSQFRLPSNIF